MPEMNTLRWGDSDIITWNNTGNPTQPVQNSKQLVMAKWPRPITWQVQFYLTATGIPAAETAVYTVQVKTLVGIGQGAIVLVKSYTFGPPYNDILDNGLVPGEMLNSQVFILGIAGSTAAGPHTVQCAILVAPNTHGDALDQESNRLRAPDYFKKDDDHAMGYRIPAGPEGLYDPVTGEPVQLPDLSSGTDWGHPWGRR